MVRRSNEKKTEKTEHSHGAEGYVLKTKLADNDAELNNKGRLFAHMTVAPHSGLGYHVHSGEKELYYVLSGKAEYNDNGTITTIEAGDVTITPSGAGHGIKNPNDEPFEFIALIVYD